MLAMVVEFIWVVIYILASSFFLQFLLINVAGSEAWPILSPAAESRKAGDSVFTCLCVRMLVFKQNIS